MKVLEMLPPGPASDRDIAIMSAGFPEGTDNPATISNFLRAQARVSRAAEKMKRARTQWLTQNKASLGGARGAINVMGLPVDAGTAFDDFMVEHGGAIVGVEAAPTAPATAPAGKFAGESDEALEARLAAIRAKK